MSSRRVRIEPIKTEKKRRITYEKRKDGLLKKAKEFSILCNVPACVIVIPRKTKDQDQPAKAETWPPEDNTVREVIAKYRASDQPRKVLSVLDYFTDKKSKVDAELAKLNHCIWERKYAAWNKRLHGCSNDELRSLLDQLNAKYEAVDQRCSMIKEGMCTVDGAGTSAQAVGSHPFTQNLSCDSSNFLRTDGKEYLCSSGMQPWFNPSPLEFNFPFPLAPPGYMPVQPYWSSLNTNFQERGDNGDACSTDLQAPISFQSMLHAWDNWNHPCNNWSDVRSSSNNLFASSGWHPLININQVPLTQNYGMPSYICSSLSPVTAMLPSFQSHSPFYLTEVPCPAQASLPIGLPDITESKAEDQTRLGL